MEVDDASSNSHFPRSTAKKSKKGLMGIMATGKDNTALKSRSGKHAKRIDRT